MSSLMRLVAAAALVVLGHVAAEAQYPPWSYPSCFDKVQQCAANGGTLWGMEEFCDTEEAVMVWDAECQSGAGTLWHTYCTIGTYCGVGGGCDCMIAPPAGGCPPEYQICDG